MVSREADNKHPGSSTTYTSDGAADDEGGRRGGDGADETADLEDEDGEEVDELDVEELVDGAVHGLQRRRGQEVGRAIPTLESVSMGTSNSMGISHSQCP